MVDPKHLSLIKEKFNQKVDFLRAIIDTFLMTKSFSSTR